MPGLWKEWKAKGRLPTLSTSPLGISPKAGEIPTFPQLRRVLHVSDRTAGKKRIGKCGRWKSGNPKPGFPLFHRPDSLRQQGGKPFMEEPPGPSSASKVGTFLKRLGGGAPRRTWVKE